MVDAATVTRRLQREFRLFRLPGEPPQENRATPENMRVLLDDLSQVTKDVTDKLNDDGTMNPEFSGELASWRVRLERYINAVEAAPPGDRAAIVNNVTAPLLLGIFPDKETRQVADAATPFIIASAANVAQQWEQERLDLFFQDVKDAVEDAADDIATLGASAATIAVVGAAIVGGLWIFTKARKGRKQR